MSAEPALVHHFSSGVYAKETRIPKGMILVQHKHHYDHLSILASGTVELEVNGLRSTITGPTCLTIEANMHHGVKALTDCVWFCIHATDIADPDKVDEVLISDSDDSEMQAIVEVMQ